MLLGCTSTSKSTVTALIVQGIKCVINIDNSIEFALGYSRSIVNCNTSNVDVAKKKYQGSILIVQQALMVRLEIG